MAPSQPMPPRFPTVNTNACFTKDEKDRIAKLLSQPLMSSLVQRRPAHAGKRTYYLDGGTSLSLANDIFGFDGWRSQIVKSEVEYAREKKKNSDRWLIGVSVIVRVELKNGSYHEDIGFGEAINLKGRGQALQKAKKEAVTDATKRALRVFGNGLGNCLRKDWYLELLKKGDTFEDLQLESYRNPRLIDAGGARKIKKPDMLSEEKATILSDIPKAKVNTSVAISSIPKRENNKVPVTEIPKTKAENSIANVSQMPPQKHKVKPNFAPINISRPQERFALSKMQKIPLCELTPVEVEVKSSVVPAPVDPKPRFGLSKVDSPSIQQENRLPQARTRFISVGPAGCVVALPSLHNPSQSPPSSFGAETLEKIVNEEKRFGIGSRKRSLSELQVIGRRSPKKPRFGKKLKVASL